ncbi:MAG: 1,4-alpha-glucan branching protein, partial [Chloroflexota bacterium]|nr:1,4-alpha-glucan branching protein [Chloroflexota bacterium]
GDSRLPDLASFYIGWHRQVLDSFRHRFGSDLVQAFRKLQDAGHLELVASAATHPFLPLMSRESTIHAQLAVGVAEYERRFGRRPRSLWLPECGYRPAYYDMAGGRAVFRPGLEKHLEELGVEAFFADSAALEGGEVSEVAGGLGSFMSVQFAARVPLQSRNLPYKSTAWPYLVSDSSVAVFGRDTLTGRQVWSATEGYPGHFSYREFHKKDAICGMRFWKITGSGIELGDKTYYEPKQALADVPRHVDHFVALLEGHVAGNTGKAAVPPAIVAPYDTELFGHWWFEGVEWLKQVLRRLAVHPDIQLTTPSAYLERYPPTERIALPESSWGAGGDARTWMNDATRWMWPIIHGYERQMEELGARFAGQASAGDCL